MVAWRTSNPADAAGLSLLGLPAPVRVLEADGIDRGDRVRVSGAKAGALA